MTPGASHVAVIRTLITCALALTLAFGGSRWQHIELVWTAYGSLALVTAKLLFEDLPHGHSGSIAISIFLYAVALIIVPRMARLGAQRRGKREFFESLTLPEVTAKPLTTKDAKVHEGNP
jgi:hypothetical protein